ncbi:MAG: hypothetical protein ACRDSJ_21110 [Rubrobacteraceae bacterium]
MMGIPGREAERVEQIESELDRIMEKRARERRDASNVEELWKESARRHNERRRKENGAAWYEHHMTLSDVHRELSAEHERRALKLLEDEQKERNQ